MDIQLFMVILKFKIYSVGHEKDMCIGIDSTNKLCLNSYFCNPEYHYDKNTQFYGYEAYGIAYKRNNMFDHGLGIKCNKKNIIILCCKRKQVYIKYCVPLTITD